MSFVRNFDRFVFKLINIHLLSNQKNISIGAKWRLYVGMKDTIKFTSFKRFFTLFRLWIDQLSIISLALLNPKLLLLFIILIKYFKNKRKHSELNVLLVVIESQFPFENNAVHWDIDPLINITFFFLLNNLWFPINNFASYFLQ